MKLHVFLGTGGVGKTTLAAGYALAIARGGGRVGLLGIDPSRRLQDALGVQLADADAPVPGAGSLRAAIVQPHQALARWVAESCAADDAARLARNPLFGALGDRLASAIDLLAAVRIAEWVERDPQLSALVVDTAPGLPALELVRSPRQLAEFVDGRMVRWLRAAATGRARLGNRILRSLAAIGGSTLVRDLAELFALARAPLATMLARVEAARVLLASGHGELLLVTSARDAGAEAAHELATALRAEHVAASAVIVNRAWPADVAAELAGALARTPTAGFPAYLTAQLRAQAEVIAGVARWAPRMIAIPPHPHARERTGLVELGDALADQLDPITTRSAS